MKELANIDLIYPIAGILFGIVIACSPRAFIRKVKISEESIKTEDMLKKLGIALIVACIVAGIYIYYKVNHA